MSNPNAEGYVCDVCGDRARVVVLRDGVLVVERRTVWTSVVESHRPLRICARCADAVDKAKKEAP